MGLSHKSHGKRSDKETQSPMLKIFRDMMQKDKRDPEKATLLKEKHQDRKRKHYSGSRSKSGRQTGSSSSDHPKNEPYKLRQQDTRNVQLDGCASQHTLPFQNEKRESWWFCGETDGKKSTSEETCSCVSCALKKLINTDYACIACVTILLFVSVAIAITLVYKSIPSTFTAEQQLNPDKIAIEKTESERLKRKIGNLGKWSFGPKKEWRNIFKRGENPDIGSFNLQSDDLSSLVDSENDLTKILDSEKLNDIQHSDRLRDFYKKLVQTDTAIRNLRKSLNGYVYVTTNNYDFDSNFDMSNNFDTSNNFNIDNNDEVNNDMDANRKVDFDNNIDADRLKRSIHFSPGRYFNFKKLEPGTQSKISNGKLTTKTTINMTSNKSPNEKDNKAGRNKRFGNFSDEGFIIEKNKVMIQYKPSRIVPKCSHSPKDSKSHEKELTHPFYKNTQRFDELLDQFIDKKLPDLLADRLTLSKLFDKNNNNKCKHPINEEIILVKDDDLIKDYELNQRPEGNQKDSDVKDYPNQRNEDRQHNNERVGTDKVLNKEEETTVKAFVIAKKEAPKIASKDINHSVNVFENDFFEDSDGVQKNLRKSTNGYDILLSISTLVNPAVKRTTNKPTTAFADRANIRKLLQTNMKAEDGVAYEDLKEVLADYKEGHDDENKENDRKKRNDDTQYDTQEKVNEIKRIPEGVHNQNWKGAMPLYPDELTQMTMKDKNSENKIEIPIHNRDSAPETDDIEPVKTDVEYVENYLNNGYERLVELAQAYSDYGVLNDKKDTTVDKKTTDKEHTLNNKREGLSMKRLKNNLKRGLSNNHLFEKLKQGRDVSEGIRIEFQPTPKDNSIRPVDDVGVKFKEIFNKHVKFFNVLEPQKVEYSIPDYTTRSQVSDLNLPANNKAKANNDKEFDPNSIIYKKRTLKNAEFVISNTPAVTMDKKTDDFDSLINFQLNNETEKDTKRNEDQIEKNILLDDQLKDTTANKRCNEPAKNISMEVGKTTLDKNSSMNLMHTKSKTQLKGTAKNDASLSNFLMLLSNWFSALDRMESGANKSNVIPSKPNAIVKKHSNESKVTESQLAYPEYDSDMIENIGHRSRVLLSVEVTNNTEKIDAMKSEDEKNQISKVPSSTEPMLSVNSTRSIHETTKSIKDIEAASNETNNRMVKRQAIDDSNLIFWNDLYDDEYGINADPIENNIRDKHSAEKNDLVKKSNTWIHDKMKKFTDRLYPGVSKKATKLKTAKDGSKQVKRDINYDFPSDDDMGKLDFAALTARMKEVCKETIKAVKDTKHIEVREDHKEGQAATSLMQQLVRLMTDLVDFQVQERTCRKLPPDLQNFLEWLTSPKEDEPIAEPYGDKNDPDHDAMDLVNKLDNPTDQDVLQTSDRENTDSKTDCLGTLHAVQNLIREYEEMSEDDKSVMTGVKNYLENQMHFLQRQLSSIDDNKYMTRGSRFRRDVIMDLGHTVSHTIDNTAQHLENQYKNFKQLYKKYKCKIAPAYKQAVQSTAELNKAVTKMAHKLLNNGNHKSKHTKLLAKHQKVLKINDKTKDKHKKEKVTKKKLKHRCLNKITKNKANSDDKVRFRDNSNYARNVEKSDYRNNDDEAYISRGKEERNIKDVYFKAVEEAKKMSMSKGAHKRRTDTFDKTKVFRINDYVGEKENF